jgi:hypothetical protein
LVSQALIAKAAVGNELAPIIDLDTLRHHTAQRFDRFHQDGSVATWSESGGLDHVW